MSGTRAGFIKARQTMIDICGGEEQYLEYKREMGRRGGKVQSPLKGFASMSPERRQELGRIGGKKSRKNA